MCTIKHQFFCQSFIYIKYASIFKCTISLCFPPQGVAEKNNFLRKLLPSTKETNPHNVRTSVSHSSWLGNLATTTQFNSLDCSFGNFKF